MRRAARSFRNEPHAAIRPFFPGPARSAGARVRRPDLYIRRDRRARATGMAQCLARARAAAAATGCACISRNSVAMIDLYLACVKLGVIFVPVNILYREREIVHILRDAEPACSCTEAELPALAAEAAAMPDDRPAVPLDGDAPAGIVYTSGTTGASKGAVLTHNNFAANALNLLTCWQITAADRFLLALPLFHVHGLGNGLHCWLAIAGAGCACCSGSSMRRRPPTFLDFRPTLFFGVPRSMCACWTFRPNRLARSAAPCGCSSPARRRCRAGVLGISRDVRARHPGALRHDRDVHEHVATLTPGSAVREASGCRCRGSRSSSWMRPARKRYWRVIKGPNVFCGILAARRCDAGRIPRRLVPDRRPRGALARRLLHAVRPPERSHHFRRLQYLSARDRGVPDGAARGGRSCRAGVPDPVRGEVPAACIVPRSDSFDPAVLETRCREAFASFKVPARIPPRSRTPPQCARKGAETSARQRGKVRLTASRVDFRRGDG